MALAVTAATACSPGPGATRRPSPSDITPVPCGDAATTACADGPNPVPIPTPPPSPPDAAQIICSDAACAYETLGDSRNLSSVAEAVAEIRQVNLDRTDSADSLFYQVWQLADAWDGTVGLLNDPSTADMASVDTVEAALGNLVQLCQQ
jgi:hypothetical protein